MADSTDAITSGGLTVASGYIKSLMTNNLIRGMLKADQNLKNELENLNSTQQAELKQRIDSVQSDLDKQSEIYKYIALARNQAGLDEISKKRTKKIILLSLGFIGIVGLMYLLKKSKNG